MTGDAARVVRVAGLEISNTCPFVLIAGPCQIESRSHALEVAHALRAVSDRILVLNFGRKVLEGPPADVMDSAVVREIYMGLKADGVA